MAGLESVVDKVAGLESVASERKAKCSPSKCVRHAGDDSSFWAWETVQNGAGSTRVWGGVQKGSRLQGPDVCHLLHRCLRAARCGVL